MLVTFTQFTPYPSIIVKAAKIILFQCGRMQEYIGSVWCAGIDTNVSCSCDWYDGTDHLGTCRPHRCPGMLLKTFLLRFNTRIKWSLSRHAIEFTNGFLQWLSDYGYLQGRIIYYHILAVICIAHIFLDLRQTGGCATNWYEFPWSYTRLHNER